MFKKLVVGVAVFTLVVSLAGCGNKQPAPAPQPQQNSQLPAGHPGETPAKPSSGAKVDQAQVESKIKELLDKKYPGDWKVSGTTLSKGSYTENKNYKIADDVATLYPDSIVSIFVGDKRISSTVRQQGTDVESMEYPVPATVGEVMKSGKTSSTETQGFTAGKKMLKVYIPLKTGDKTVAVLSASVPE